MRIIVRAAREGDLSQLQDIEVDAGKVFAEIGLASIAAADPPSLELLRAHLERGTLWVAVDPEDRPVAYASASVVDGEGHLDQVSVRRSYARRGIGAALVEHVCEWAMAPDLHAVTLTTFRDVEWNGPLYERYGFVPLAEDRARTRAVRDPRRGAGGRDRRGAADRHASLAVADGGLVVRFASSSRRWRLVAALPSARPSTKSPFTAWVVIGVGLESEPVQHATGDGVLGDQVDHLDDLGSPFGGSLTSVAEAGEPGEIGGSGADLFDGLVERERDVAVARAAAG